MNATYGSTPSPERPRAFRKAGIAAIGAVTAMTLLLSGCSAPPWEQEAYASPEPSATVSTTRATTASPTPTSEPSAETETETAADPAPEASAEETSEPAPQDNDDFPTGAASHRLQAGAVELEVNYWTTLSRDRWSPAAVKPLSLSITSPNTEDAVVTSVQLVIEPRVNGSAAASPEIVREADLPVLGAVIAAPTTYSWTAALPAVDDDVTAIRVVALIEVAIPDSRGGAPVIQTATDQLTITLSES